MHPASAERREQVAPREASRGSRDDDLLTPLDGRMTAAHCSVERLPFRKKPRQAECSLVPAERHDPGAARCLEAVGDLLL